MDAEEDRELEARARRHAALAEPVRLRIVDLLALGDLSPTELGRRLGLTSNLLAHHLNVLEAEGLVRRDRSEGDGRRSYVRLDAHSLIDPTPARTVTAPRVVFVCTANSARSQLAQALWGAASPVPALSAGTHPADRVAPAAIDVAARHGLDLTQAVPRLVDDRITASDLIITVCDRAHEEYPATSLHWSVPDPVRVGTRAAFDEAFSELETRVSWLAPLVRLAA
ncbi:protein-tyrosine-phosphatase/DNA-binding transcriptional ArsR family regulator [Microbacterium sp. W4I4]|uniref:arsenate reductase/protein-tyrosine-phosphatase family protein n=1 Tax=Microbacterium sp. W4I4 TaxID=3042295 RepID=UPI002782455B|nr:MarR family transcriptional regulator [Microbacterium sp. W4I4]MDQ0615416.1 protein-tyrosine-phosphatase/DNA-binding transcriptional ArsR family regulator [Microbacterium sp. W4I4]